MATKSLAHGMDAFCKDCEHPQTCWSMYSHEYTIRCRSGLPATPTSAVAAVTRSVRWSTEAERSETALSSACRGASRRPRTGPVSKPSAERVSWPSATRHGPPTSSSTASTASTTSTASTARELAAISEQLAGRTPLDYAVPFVYNPERAHSWPTRGA
ncbi:hypothetical protein [Streptomyces sp. NBC_01207]|uniref:hypothetical protein n=1 Tax=Streptomyces sp. NBC_01207 TaxID=2903772 RepID=UPI002E0F54EB|nr:hypothetical protein OG457_05945 [Streptomyces sp. NBC_01207]